MYTMLKELDARRTELYCLHCRVLVVIRVVRLERVGGVVNRCVHHYFSRNAIIFKR